MLFIAEENRRADGRTLHLQLKQLKTAHGLC
jgi:hypothetical protein